LHMTQVTLNGLSLGKAGGGPLRPGEYLVVADDTALFRARYGPLKIRLLEPAGWRPLRNSGDTLRLAAAGFPLDSIAYAGRDLGTGKGCLARGPDGGWTAASSGGESSPGYSLPPISRMSWALSARKVDAGRPDRPLYVEVSMPPAGGYTLQVFDLEGNCVRDLGRGDGGKSGGKTVHRWEGEGRDGGRLAPGAYLLCLRSGGRDTRKRVVIVEGSR
jgi:hypothetical protein